MKRLLLFLTGFFSCMALFAQRSVSGRVTDQNGIPLQNASVTVKETGAGVSTTPDGRYVIQIDSRARVLVFSYVGRDIREEAIGNRTSIDVSLIESAVTTGEEVVVVAYGTAKKGTITNSVSQLSAVDLENRPVTNALSAIAGVAPGVVASSVNGQPGSSPLIRIRGFGSINGSNAPLYVVDGVPYDYDISNINVDDIENISLLKDAAASSLYGARAANGVVQITTKRGKKDKSQLQASIAQGFISRGIPEYERVGPKEYYPLMWEAYRNSLVYPVSGAPLHIDSASKIASGLMPRNGAGLQVYDGRTYSDIRQLLGYNPFNVGNTDIIRVDGTLNPNAQLLYGEDLDWLKDIMRSGNRGDYTLSMSGGSAKTDYYMSLGYTNEKGFVLNSDYKRYSARLNINTQPVTGFKAGANLGIISTRANQGASDGSGAGSTGLVNPFYTSRMIGPIYPVYAHDPATGEYLLDGAGNRIYDIGSLAALGLPNRPQFTGRHAIYETILNENLLKRNVLSGRVYGEISFLKHFRFTANVTADMSTSVRSQAENKIVGDGAPNGRSRRNTSDNLTMTINQLLNYNQTFGVHSLEALVGHENYDATYFTSTNLKTGQVIDGITELSNYTTISSLTSYTDKYKIESFLSRLNYSYDNKYFFSASLRRDGSSRFSPENRWGNFWSAGLAWRLDRENFIQTLPFISSLRLRSSYGEVGNDDLLDANGFSIYYAYQSFYNLGDNNNSEAGAAQSTTAGNRNLGWEVNKQFDAALEFGLWKERLTGTVEFFNRKSSNLLFRVPPPVSSGTLSGPRNIGSMYNRGVEISLTGNIIRSKDLNWSLTTNWTTFSNKVTELPNDKIASPSSATQQLEVGHSRYEFYLREYMGVDPSNGAALYRADLWDAATCFVNSKGDTVTSNHNNARFHYSGSAIPDFFGSLISNLNYKGFNLSFQLNYQIGGEIYDGNYQAMMHSGTYGMAMHKDNLNRWRQPGDETSLPRLDAGRSTAFAAQSDRWLIDASYLTIQNVTLSYTLPSKFFGTLPIQRLRVYLSGENLHMFSKRTGLNPLQNFTGVTTNVYVPSRIITAGLNLTL